MENILGKETHKKYFQLNKYQFTLKMLQTVSNYICEIIL